MAPSFIPQSDPYTIPSGLTQTQTNQGGTAYVDASGNLYVRNASGFQLNTNPGVTAATAPIAMSAGASAPPIYAQAPAPQSSGVSGVSVGISPGGSTVTFSYGGKQYNVPAIPGKTADEAAQSYAQQNLGMAAPKAQSSAPNISQNLQPGMSGNDVQQLQQWLISQGYAIKDGATGYYGPETKAAVTAWQNASGIDTQGNPGYFGPISRAYIQNNQGSATSGGAAGGGTAGGAAPSTGNPNLDSILQSLQGLLDSNKAVIPPGLQITPALTQQFLSWAHQAVDPQTQQLIQSEITNINSNLSNLATQYENNKAETLQNFGTNLATEQNAAGGSGTAFSGMRNLTENNMAASTNRTLSSLASDTAYNMGQAARTGAANVGAANAGGINMPTLTGANVGITGGSRGTATPSNALDFSYNPSLYTAGNIPTSQNTAVNNLASNYLNQYTTLAGNNSGRSMSDLIGGVTGLPSNYQIPPSLT
jgi:peptidoglycan hydrolase-like protein with peptidoglycan-binding domain